MIGAQYDLTDFEAIYQGAEWYHEFQLLDPATDLPYDLTGCAVRSQARNAPVDTIPVITFTCTVPVPLEGVIRLSLNHTDTTAIPAGTYVYDVELVDGGGQVFKAIVPSYVQVVAEYTK